MENEVLKVIKNRRSTRKYKEKQINEEELQALLEAGIHAPSAINAQSWHFTVIQDKKLINHMSDKTREVMCNNSDEMISSIGRNIENIFYNAPTLIIVSGKKDVASSLVDCSAAIENILIGAESIGLGAVWIGLVKFLFAIEEEINKINLPDGYKPLYAISVGYKANDISLEPLKRNREVVNYIR